MVRVGLVHGEGKVGVWLGYGGCMVRVGLVHG